MPIFRLHSNYYCYHFYGFDDRRKYNGIASSKCKTYVGIPGISHAGFMLMTLLSTTNAAGTLLYYTSAYALAGIAALV
jgi:hypothetical protein